MGFLHEGGRRRYSDSIAMDDDMEPSVYINGIQDMFSNNKSHRHKSASY